MNIFFVQFFCVFLLPLLNIFYSAGPYHFCPLLKTSLHEIFLKRCLVFPILFFSYISLHCSLRKAFLSLLAILWNSAFKWECICFSPLLFTSLLFTAICKASPDSHFPFMHSFSMGMVFFFLHFFFSWRLITLQYCSGFCHTLTWISHGFTWGSSWSLSPIQCHKPPSIVHQTLCLSDLVP